MINVRSDLEEIFREVFDDDEINIYDEMTADDIDDWDSLEHINLIVAVEKKFKIKFSTAEISELKSQGENVGTFITRIESKMVC
jgi:acyl carrier protein